MGIKIIFYFRRMNDFCFYIYLFHKKNHLSFWVLALTILILSSCQQDEGTSPSSESSSAHKILPLGASRVEGARPIYESYRYELWKLLTEESLDFDYIGSQTDAAIYPDYNGQSFDTDHEGRGGATSGDILAELEHSLAEIDTPDIVLISSPGGNDALEGLPYDEAVANIEDIILLLQADNPTVTIFIEQMAPGNTEIMTDELTLYFNEMHQDVLTLANQYSTSQSQIIAIDMYSGFQDSYLADEVHYNQAGAEFIAQRYYARLVPFLTD